MDFLKTPKLVPTETAWAESRPKRPDALSVPGLANALSSPEMRTALRSRGRKFGGNDLRRFDNLAPWHVCAGEKDIGNVHVDCRLLVRESKWGIMGDDRHPSGIIQLDIGFHQPDGCRLKSATVKVTLDEKDAALNPYKKPENVYLSHIPVQIRSWGPRTLTGEKRTIDVATEIKATPSIMVGAAGFGGMGMKKRTSRERVSRWRVHSQPKRAKNNNVYEGVVWTLDENGFDKKLLPGGNMFAAFAFENSGQPFLMRIAIEGKLATVGSRVQDKSKRLLNSLKSNFGPRKGQDHDISTTLIGAATPKTLRLDGLADSLPQAMEMKNVLNGVPVEMPDSHANVNYFDDTQKVDDPEEEEIKSPSAAPRGPSATVRHPQLRPPAPGIQLQIGNDPTEPSWENLAGAHERYFRPLVRYPAALPDLMEESTLAASILASRAVEDTKTPHPVKVDETIYDSDDRDAISRFRAMLRWLAGLILLVAVQAVQPLPHSRTKKSSKIVPQKIR
jgi:hypothetical protein